jgi:hypothetical protein
MPELTFAKRLYEHSLWDTSWLLGVGYVCVWIDQSLEVRLRSVGVQDPLPSEVGTHRKF